MSQRTMKMPRGICAILLVVGVGLAACAAPPQTTAPTQLPAAVASNTSQPTEVAAATGTSGPTNTPEAYKPVIRKAEKPWRIGFGDGYGGIPFTNAVWKNVQDVAAQMGVDASYCDNASDQTKTIACLNSFVVKKMDGVIFANWIGGSEPAMAAILHKANIPCVTWSGAHPGCVDFGVDGYTANVQGGNWLGAYAAKQGWDPNQTAWVVIWNPDIPFHKQEADGAKAGMAQSGFNVPASNIFDVPQKTASDPYPNMLAWLTGHPNFKNVLCFGIAGDSTGVACNQALKDRGYLGRAAVGSTGATEEALVEFRTHSDAESTFKVSIAYFPEHWGEYMVPIIVDLIEGKSVPSKVTIPTTPITRDNIDQYYPQATPTP